MKTKQPFEPKEIIRRIEDTPIQKIIEYKVTNGIGYEPLHLEAAKNLIIDNEKKKMVEKNPAKLWVSIARIRDICNKGKYETTRDIILE